MCTWIENGVPAGGRCSQLPPVVGGGTEIHEPRPTSLAVRASPPRRGDAAPGVLRPFFRQCNDGGHAAPLVVA